jgi:hypothetical protein
MAPPRNLPSGHCSGQSAAQLFPDPIWNVQIKSNGSD